MKKLFSTLAVATLTSSVIPPRQQLHYQTQVVFQDTEVPVFVVIEQKGQKKVVIDRSHIKSSLDKQSFSDTPLEE